jgi:hypothetical protein
MCFVLSVACVHHVSSKRTFMDFALSDFFSIFPNGFFYHVSSERIFMDFILSGFLFIFPRGFISCLFKREPRILPSMALRFHLPRGFLYSVSLRGNHRFCIQQLYTLHFPEDLHRVSSKRTPPLPSLSPMTHKKTKNHFVT